MYIIIKCANVIKSNKIIFKKVLVCKKKVCIFALGFKKPHKSLRIRI